MCCVCACVRKTGTSKAILRRGSIKALVRLYQELLYAACGMCASWLPTIRSSVPLCLLGGAAYGRAQLDHFEEGDIKVQSCCFTRCRYNLFLTRPCPPRQSLCPLTGEFLLPIYVPHPAEWAGGSGVLGFVGWLRGLYRRRLLQLISYAKVTPKK
jgi:hypothetical protein